jgi:hypothetical protein
MRSMLLVLLVGTAPFIASAHAAGPHFCAVDTHGARNCSYASMAECQAAMPAAGKCAPETVTAARPAKAASTVDDQLDKLLDRLNKKSDTLILCRGC